MSQFFTGGGLQGAGGGIAPQRAPSQGQNVTDSPGVNAQLSQMAFLEANRAQADAQRDATRIAQEGAMERQMAEQDFAHNMALEQREYEMQRTKEREALVRDLARKRGQLVSELSRLQMEEERHASDPSTVERVTELQNRQFELEEELASVNQAMTEAQVLHGIVQSFEAGVTGEFVEQAQQLIASDMMAARAFATDLATAVATATTALSGEDEASREAAFVTLMETIADYAVDGADESVREAFRAAGRALATGRGGVQRGLVDEVANTLTLAMSRAGADEKKAGIILEVLTGIARGGVPGLFDVAGEDEVMGIPPRHLETADKILREAPSELKEVVGELARKWRVKMAREGLIKEGSKYFMAPSELEETVSKAVAALMGEDVTYAGMMQALERLMEGDAVVLSPQGAQPGDALADPRVTQMLKSYLLKTLRNAKKEGDRSYRLLLELGLDPEDVDQLDEVEDYIKEMRPKLRSEVDALEGRLADLLRPRSNPRKAELVGGLEELDALAALLGGV